MGRRSVKENKSAFQIARECCGLSREQASEQLGFITDARLYKIETNPELTDPEEARRMAEVYKAPELCAYYCANLCGMGNGRVVEPEEKSLSQLAVETVNAVNRLNREKDRLMEIVEDGRIDDDQYEDFNRIRMTLRQISVTAGNLEFWLENMINDGKVDATRLN